MISLELAAILLGWALAGGSPGPATLTIAAMAMSRGRSAGVIAGAGILLGSAVWGFASALGMGTLMLAHAWVFTALKYIGAGYLGYLALKSLRSAMSDKPLTEQSAIGGSLSRVFVKSVAIHLTNPKAILSWGAIYAIALPVDASFAAIFVLYFQLLAVSAIVFIGYGLLFSTPWISAGYKRARRGFELGFGLLFGAASVKILTTRAAL